MAKETGTSAASPDLMTSALVLIGHLGHFQHQLIDAVHAGRPLPADATATMQHADTAIEDAANELAALTEQGHLRRPRGWSLLATISQGVACRIAALGVGSVEPGTAEYDRLTAFLNRLSADITGHIGSAPTDRQWLYTDVPEQSLEEIDIKHAHFIAARREKSLKEWDAIRKRKIETL